ncbi:signal peptidase I [Butyrivibrio sp. DSM 10294]|nr:signal peptidase I [Butyrivibrio sp. DSM 10294]
MPTDTILVTDNNGPDTLKIWIILYFIFLILYMVVCLVHDVKRDIRLEQLPPQEKVNSGAIPSWLQYILRIVIPAIGVYIIVNHVIAITNVASCSMEPKLNVGNTAVYNRLAYRKSEPLRGDVIEFWSDEYGKIFAKRVIGVAGDKIEFHNGFVYINGLKADESAYIGVNVETNSNKTFTVPDGYVFVLGDNRENSLDARYWNEPYISCDRIIGKYIGQLPFALPGKASEGTPEG